MVINKVLDELFRTWSHVAVLRALLDTATGFTGNKVARSAGMDPKAALQSLGRLEELGIVRRQRGGRDHLFTLNRNHFLVEQGIIPLFVTEQQFLEEVKSAIASAMRRRSLSVVMFGSVAREKETPQSDLDLCCIVQNKSQLEQAQSALDRIGTSLRDRFGVKVGPVFFTLDEFRKKAAKRNRLINEILDQGKLISGKNPKTLLRAKTNNP